MKWGGEGPRARVFKRKECAVNLVIHADGGCEPNPGEGRCGVIVHDERGVLQHSLSLPIGWATNNIAEWRALIEAFKYALSVRASSVTVRMDSRLVVEQINKRWKVKDSKLKPLSGEATVLWNELRQLPCAVHVEWVPREHNELADALSR